MSTSTVNKTPSTAKTAANPQQQRGLLVIGGIVVAAVVAVVLVIALGSQRAATIDYSTIPTSRTTDGAFVLGNADAPVTLVVFADFACPHCQAYHSTMQQFIRDFVVTGQARFEYRILPTTGGATSVFTGQLLQCAEEAKPGSFWTGKELMYTYATSGRYNAEIGRTFANDIGVSYGDLLECAEGANQVTIDSNFANQMGITGTPGVMVRYGSDSTPVWVNANGTVYDRGGPPFSALATVVNTANSSPS